MMHFTSDFPRGLRVLVVDPDAHFRVQSEQQLRQCSYCVTTTGSVSEAVALLRGVQPGSSCGSRGGATCNSTSPFDVMLVEARLLLPEHHGSHHSRKLVKLCRTLPFILMSASPSPDEVRVGVGVCACTPSNISALRALFGPPTPRPETLSTQCATQQLFTVQLLVLARTHTLF
eukprot:1146070-Pelagomonas_calceolata.AAC.2